MELHFMTAWANRWGVNPQALHELAFLCQQENDYKGPVLPGDDEDAAQSEVLAAGGNYGLLMRNNVGALKDATGRLVRYGLMNETKDRNTKFKSSDVIGLYRVTITPDMIGQTIGQFWAVECKPRAWRFSGTAHETAQLAFGNLVRSYGGRFTFATGAKDL